MSKVATLRKRRVSHSQRAIVNNAAVANCILGPLHASVCEVCHHGTTAHALRFETGLPKRTVDSVVHSLLKYKLLVAQGPRLYWVTHSPDAVKKIFGAKRAASFMVYPSMASKVQASRSRYFKRRKKPDKK